jgi:mannose-6-phosphate isomerase-like protein (cupin superfamily)/catechol 2,3-dioxygenase-like lactoylglutathione lyase family enzyme
MIAGINHVTLSVSNLNRSFDFYTRILGLKPVARWADGVYLEAGNDWICLSRDESTRHGPLPEYTHLAFTVSEADFDQCAQSIKSCKVEIWKDNRSEGKSLYLLDPDGHKLEIHAGNLESRLTDLRKRPYKGLEFYTETTSARQNAPLINEATKAISRENARHYTWGQQCDGWHLLDTPGLSVIQERVPAGAGEVRHYHEHARQFFFVLSGTATLESGGRTERLAPGQGCHVPPGQPHQLFNEGPAELEFLVISAPRAHGDRIVDPAET